MPLRLKISKVKSSSSSVGIGVTLKDRIYPTALTTGDALDIRGLSWIQMPQADADADDALPYSRTFSQLERSQSSVSLPGDVYDLATVYVHNGRAVAPYPFMLACALQGTISPKTRIVWTAEWQSTGRGDDYANLTLRVPSRDCLREEDIDGVTTQRQDGIIQASSRYTGTHNTNWNNTTVSHYWKWSWGYGSSHWTDNNAQLQPPELIGFDAVALLRWRRFEQILNVTDPSLLPAHIDNGYGNFFPGYTFLTDPDDSCLSSQDDPTSLAGTVYRQLRNYGGGVYQNPSSPTIPTDYLFSSYGPAIANRSDYRNAVNVWPNEYRIDTGILTVTANVYTTDGADAEFYGAWVASLFVNDTAELPWWQSYSGSDNPCIPSKLVTNQAYQDSTYRAYASSTYCRNVSIVPGESGRCLPSSVVSSISSLPGVGYGWDPASFVGDPGNAPFNWLLLSTERTAIPIWGLAGAKNRVRFVVDNFKLSSNSPAIEAAAKAALTIKLIVPPWRSAGDVTLTVKASYSCNLTFPPGATEANTPVVGDYLIATTVVSGTSDSSLTTFYLPNFYLGYTDTLIGGGPTYIRSYAFAGSIVEIEWEFNTNVDESEPLFYYAHMTKLTL